VVSGYWAFNPRWLQPIMSVFFLDLQHWNKQTRQLANLKRRVERTAPVTMIPTPFAEPVAASVGMP
jgi:hypothetical protein